MLQKVCISAQKPIFIDYKAFHRRDIVHPSQCTTEIAVEKNFAVGIVVDSEFYAPSINDHHNENFQPRKPVTIQVKGFFEDDAQIYVHPQFEAEAIYDGKTTRHLAAKPGFIIRDYLESHGLQVEISRDPDREDKLPKILVVVAAHFMLADLSMCTVDEFDYERALTEQLPEPTSYRSDIIKKFSRKQITMNRRMTGGRAGRINMPWYLMINGYEYQVQLQLIDTAAIHGVASYKEFCSNSGIKLDAKDLVGDWITRMDEAYFEIPDEFDAYALGDLRVYDALVKNAENMRTVARDIGIGEYFDAPKLSIGATVAGLFEQRIYKHFGIDPTEANSREFKKGYIDSPTTKVNEFFARRTYKASGAFFTTLGATNAYQLAKCDGGRCHSNNPLLTVQRGELVDLDIAGAYGSAMSGLIYPFGTPVIYATRYNKKQNSGIPLRRVLDSFKKELVPGLWYARIKVADLEFEQDFIPSWCDYTRFVNVAVGQDDDPIQTGIVKIFTREIKDGCLTSDILDVIDQWNPRQRNEFYDKCEVLSIAFYPKTFEVSLDEFNDESNSREFKFRSNVLNGFELVTQENHLWTGVKLGEFFTDVLRAKRAQHPKGSPLNSLYKLLTNTSYGIMVSRFFVTANVVIGNQITARVRSMMWLTEKALNLNGSITDGQVFDLNSVMHRKGNRLVTTGLARQYLIDKRSFYNSDGGRFAPIELPDLPGIKRDKKGRIVIDPKYKDHTPDKLNALTKDEKGEFEQLKNTINESCLAHVQKVWYDMPLLKNMCNHLDTRVNDGHVRYIEKRGAFEFEMKEFTSLVVAHGSSNYSFDPFNRNKTKFRSYENKRDHDAYTVNHDEVVLEGELEPRPLLRTDEYSDKTPAMSLLIEIMDNPHNVKRLPPFVKTAILKPTAYAASLGKGRKESKWIKSSFFQPGDNILKVGKPAYFSIAQFSYQSYEQFKGWKTAFDKLKRRSGESFEIYYSNSDGTIDYFRMINEIDGHIQQTNRKSKPIINPINEIFDKHRHTIRIIQHLPSIVSDLFEATELLKTNTNASMFVETDDEEYELIDTSDY